MNIFRHILCVVCVCLALPMWGAGQETVLLDESFATSFGSFTLDEQKYAGCTHSTQWYIKTQYGYAVNSANQQGTSLGASDCKLVSPAVNMSGYSKVTLSFEHATYSGSSSDSNYLKLLVKKQNGAWVNIPIPAWSSKRWEFTPVSVDLTTYQSTGTSICFEYTSTANYAPSWELKNVKIIGLAAIPCSPTQYEEESTTICDTLLPYSWKGYLFTGPGVVYDTLRTKSGCDSICYTYSLDTVHCQAPDCPYKLLSGLQGNEILEALRQSIKSHKVLTYSQVRADNAKVDIRSNNTVVDMYSGCTFYSSDYCSGTNYDTDIECECYNREHLLPKSWWGGSDTTAMYTDLYHIIPTDNVANTKRSAWILDEVKTASWSNSVGSKLGTSTNWNSETAFEPPAAVKGDIARIYFYMITCYNNRNFTVGGKGYRFFTYTNGKAAFTDNALTLLLKWHREDPVSEVETTRAEKVATKQGNHNPYVEEPELVEYIWGNKKGKKYYCNDITAEESVVCEEWDGKGQVYTLMGVPVGFNRILPPGIYVVVTEYKVMKILVK